MKAKHLLLTILSFIIGMMMNGQKNNHRADYRMLPVLGSESNKAKTAISTTSSAPSQKEKVYPTLVSSIEGDAKQIATSSGEIQSISSSPINNNTFNYNSNPNCYNTKIYADELTRQAEELQSTAAILKKEAIQKKGREREVLMLSVNQMNDQAVLRLIQASEIQGRINQETFKNDVSKYQELLLVIKSGESILEQAKSLHAEAIHHMKMGKEMREEAYAMPSNSSKLGSMSNAEEEEITAINKQQEAYMNLKKLAMSTNYINQDLASR